MVFGNFVDYIDKRWKMRGLFLPFQAENSLGNK